MVYKMKNQWKRVRSIVFLAVLPLVATAAASAHQWMNDSNPIAVDVKNQVSVGIDQLGSDRIHTVALNRAGAIEGRIASIDRDTKQSSGLGALKIFFVRDGKIAQETVTAEDGTFTVQGVAEGAYSFVATGKNGFAAYGVQVVAHGDSDNVNVMEAAAVSPRLAVVKKILEQQLPLEVTTEILAVAGAGLGEQVVGANRVRLIDGKLSGHVVPLVGNVEVVKGTYVHILKNDDQVAEVQADEHGSFMVEDLEPGVYDFVAAGSSGFAAVSFEAVNQVAEAKSVVGSDSEEVPVSIAQDVVPTDVPYVVTGYADSLDVRLTGGQDSGFISNQMDYGTSNMGYVDSAPIEYASESIGCGSAVGGSCGSCGNFSGYSSCNSCNSCGSGGGGGAASGGRFFGRGGGLGRLLLLGGIAGGIVAIASDPKPVSPAS